MSAASTAAAIAATDEQNWLRDTAPPLTGGQQLHRGDDSIAA
jgi:hypothetical protein